MRKPTEAAETPYKIRIGFPSLAFSYMPYYVAQEKGFLKKYNIESEYIQITTSIQPQAVVAGNINYFTSVSTAISAAIAGLPLVIVINFFDVSPWVLVTHKEINKPQDLIGKTVALSGLRTSPYYYFQAVPEEIGDHRKRCRHHQHRRHRGQFSRVDQQPRRRHGLDAALRRQGGLPGLQEIHALGRAGGHSVRRYGRLRRTRSRLIANPSVARSPR